MKLSRPGRVATINVSIAAVLIVALVVGFVVLRGGGTKASASTQRTATVSTGDVTATVSATGTSGPTSTTDVSFASSGTIASIKVKVGSAVKKGQVLATLDSAALQTSIDVAQAKLDAAQDQYTAALESYDAAVTAANSPASNANSANGSSNGQSDQSSAGSVSSASAQLASARANRLQAQTDLDTAQQALDGATLRSPRAGTVLTVNGTVGGSSGGNGSAANADATSSALFSIADLTQMQVSAAFAEADAMQLKVGQVATTVFNAASQTPVTGKVTSVAPTPTTSNNVVSYAVTISLPTLPKGLRAGQTATVSVTTGSASNVLTVPSSAVTSVGGTHSVTVVAGGKQTRTAVQVGLEGDQLTEITSGLTAGQTVVLTTATSTSGSNSFPRGDFPGGGIGGGGLVVNGSAPAGGAK